MLKNHLKIAARNLLKHKAYSSINVLGLAIGMACCILILLYVQNELSYDRHHQNAERIYRVTGDIKFGGNHFQLAVAPAPMAEALVRDFPEVVAARFRNYGSSLVKKAGEQNFKEPRVIFADNAIFDIFTIPLLAGEAKTALTAPNTLVINQSTAKKYFGNSNPTGQALIFDNTDTYKVTGVIADMPANSHCHFDFIAWPVAWYAMNRWLQDFAYRVNISWWVFALAGGLALLIALLTVSTQAIKAALANPVEALRYE